MPATMITTRTGLSVFLPKTASAKGRGLAERKARVVNQAHNFVTPARGGFMRLTAGLNARAQRERESEPPLPFGSFPWDTARVIPDVAIYAAPAPVELAATCGDRASW